MDKFVTYLGGVIGGYALIRTPVEDTLLSDLNPFLDLVGGLTMIVFAGTLVVRGAKSLMGKP